MKNLFNRIKLSILFRTIARAHPHAKYTKVNGCPLHVVKTFKNGYGFSIIGGVFGMYGNGITSFELAVLYNGTLTYNTEITNDVLGHLSLKETLQTIKRIKKL